MTHALALLLTFLCNALWQAPLLLGAGWLGARLLRAAGPASTYRLWSAVLALQVIMPLLCTAAGATAAFGLGWWPILAGRETSAGVTVTFGEASVLGAAGVPLPWMQLACGLYGVLLLLLTGRLLRTVWRTARLRRDTSVPKLSLQAAAVWAKYRAAPGLQRTELLESPAVPMPMTMGFVRPCLLLPAGLADRVSPVEWQALLAHECAHVRRHDFLRNLLWEVATLPLAWHPAVGGARAALGESREWICDAVAVQQVGAPREYALALLRLATLLLPAPPAPHVHAIGMLDANAFERRVMRLTQRKIVPSALRRTLTLVASVALAGTTCASAWAFRTGVWLPRPASAGTGAPTIRVSSNEIAGNVRTQVPPVYPQEARDQHVEGAVVLHAVISKEGTIEQLTVISGPEALQTSALDAVRQWTYRPYVLNGEPTDVETTITVNYHLNP